MGKIYFIIDCAIVLDCELSYYILWDRLQILTDSECNCANIAMLIVWLCNSYHVDCAIVTILIVRLCKNLHFDCAIMWKYAFWLCDCVKICNFIVRLCDCAWLCWLCVIVWFTLSQLSYWKTTFHKRLTKARKQTWGREEGVWSYGLLYELIISKTFLIFELLTTWSLQIRNFGSIRLFFKKSDRKKVSRNISTRNSELGKPCGEYFWIFDV